MNTLEFKAAIRPQLIELVRTWLWRPITTGELYAVAAGFRNHMRHVLLHEKSCASLRNLIEELPLSLVNNDQLEDLLCKHIVDTFLVAVNRYQHLDRSAYTPLKIKAYHYRLQHTLDELLSQALAERDRISATRKTAGKPFNVRTVVKVTANHAPPGTNTWGQQRLRGFAFFSPRLA